MRPRTPPIIVPLLAALAAAAACGGGRAPQARPAQNVRAPQTAVLPKAAPLTERNHAVRSAKWRDDAELIRIGLAGEGEFIIIQFRMNPQKAGRLGQGTVYVIDEDTRRAYREVPVMPALGPLLARPRQPGQAGYAMLVNAPAPLGKGAVVTVVLGNYRQEHVLIQ